MIRYSNFVFPVSSIQTQKSHLSENGTRAGVKKQKLSKGNLHRLSEIWRISISHFTGRQQRLMKQNEPDPNFWT